MGRREHNIRAAGRPVRKPAARGGSGLAAPRRSCAWGLFAVAVPCLLCAIGQVGSSLERHGLELLERGEHALASEQLDRAVRLSRYWVGLTGWLMRAAPAGSLGWPGAAPETSYALGRALLQRGGASSTISAIEHFETALHGNPNLWPAHANLATVRQGLGHPQAALEALQRAIDILVIRADGAPAPVEPERVLADLHFQQGVVLESLPDKRCEGGSCKPHALDAYQRALVHASDHARASAAAKRLGSSTGSPALHDERRGRGGADGADAPAVSEG